MALPPTIPTSFVPRPPAAATQRFRFDFIGAFSFLCYLVFIGMLAAAAGVFLYDNMLTNKKAEKDAELTRAEAEIDMATAQSFIRLSDRLSSSKNLLNNHLAFSNFFRTLEEVLPTNVRFTNLHIAPGDRGVITFDGSGVAKNFNALAAASQNFARDGHIKDAIFSRISVNKDNTVTFSIAAGVDPALVTFKAPAVPPPQELEEASTTPAL